MDKPKTHMVALLSRSHHDPDIWAKLVANQKALRLQSLQLSPESFSSTYEKEAALTDQEWETRLTDPRAFTFVATTSDDTTNGEWDGMAVLVSLEETASAQLASEASEDAMSVVKFGLYGLYVLPNARGHGLGRRLVKAAMTHAKTLASQQGAGYVVISVSAAEGNTTALRLYEGLGFRVMEVQDELVKQMERVDMGMRIVL